VEVSDVRRRVQQAIAAGRDRAQARRQQNDVVQRAYEPFLRDVATPLVRQLANVLKVEGYPFTLFTAGDSLRLASDRGRDDYIELALDTAGATPQVVGRVSRTRGSRTISEERPLKDGVSPADLHDADVLDFFMDALGPWLER
jgi:hypothetical protein